jgi:beta-phosphoglucomutase-like phosphatase (HAD superfamily)
MDTRTNYWLETFSEILSEENIELPLDAIERIAKSISTSHEMYSEYMGEHNIPNPYKTEMANIEKKHAAQLRDNEKVVSNLKQAFANARGIPVEAVGIDNDNRVWVNPKRI